MIKTVLRLLILFLLMIFWGCVTRPVSEDVKLLVNTQDVDRFYKALEYLGEDEPLTGEYLYDNYLKDGSKGLKSLLDIQEGVKPDEEFLNAYASDMQNLRNFLLNNKGEIVKNVASAAQASELARKFDRALEGLYRENYSNKTVYFVIGTFRQLGGAFKEGIKIDVSMFFSDNIDYSENILFNNMTERLGSKEQARGFMAKFLPRFSKGFAPLLAHELVHVIQMSAPSLPEGFYENFLSLNLLQVALLEGGADYLAELALGKATYREFGKERFRHVDNNGNAERLLNEFLTEAHLKLPETVEDEERQTEEDIATINTVRKWIYNLGNEYRKDGVSDLGYNMGYLIAEKYFERNVRDGASRKEAIRKLIEAGYTKSNARDFLEGAGLEMKAET